MRLTLMSQLLSPHFENIPEELQAHPRWAVWKGVPRGNGKFSKPPTNPNTGSYLKPNSTIGWVSFEEAKKAYESKQYDGVGILLTEEDVFCAVDIDDCLHDGVLTDEAADIISSLGTYTEISPSRKGIHCISSRGATQLKINGNKSGDVEFYVKDRFITITGRIYGFNK